MGVGVFFSERNCTEINASQPDSNQEENEEDDLNANFA